MPRYKDSEREEITGSTRQALLEAATAEFARAGYGDANVNSISRAAGFAKGTIYNYFPSKRALMEALIDEIAELHLRVVVEAVSQVEAASHRLVRFFDTARAFVSQHHDQARIMINTVYGPDEEFRLRALHAYQPMFRLVAEEIVARGIAQGTFRAVDPEPTSRLLMTIYLVMSSHVASDGQPWLDPAQVVEFMLRGLEA
jgi:AcrR family transcriptional regulator